MTTERPETVLIAGAGIAGLGAALALAAGGCVVTVLDRDPPPPALDPEAAFHAWERKGVTQLRHSHVFLGRLFNLIRDRYPALLAELKAAGARETTFADGLPLTLRSRFRPEAGDEDLSFLFSRRTTLELVMRRFAERQAGVRFVTGASVKGLLLDRGGPLLTVRGLTVETDGAVREMTADIVVDALGRNTRVPDWLAEAGVSVAADEAPCGILYFTRHYRLRDGQGEPERSRAPMAGDLGYVKFGVFAADNRHFSITLAVPEIEIALRTAVVRPETFDRVCALIPGAARWTDPARSEPVSKVFGMGNLMSQWRRYVEDGAPSVLNLFAVGDSAIRTNPLYGRGCSSGWIHAHILADVVAAHADPAGRARAFDAESRRILGRYYAIMVKQDLQAIRRAKNERDPAYRPRWKARAIRSFAEDAIAPATRASLPVFRAFMRGFHMLEAPADWLKRPAILARVLAIWALPKPFKTEWYAPPLGPRRAEMLGALGLPL